MGQYMGCPMQRRNKGEEHRPRANRLTAERDTLPLEGE
jgi:hypothetical protein